MVYLAARRADVIFAQDTVSVGFPAILAGRVAGVPVVVRVPGDHAWEQARVRYGVQDSIEDFQRTQYGWRIELLKRVRNYVVRHAARVVVPSHYFRTIVSSWCTDPHAVHVVYNGIESVEASHSVLADVPPHPFMLSVGRFVPWKGFGELIDLLDALPQWSLVLVGDGPLRADLERRAKKTGRVVFAGTLSRAEVLAWYTHADCFVLNTSWESFSFQTVEAMAAGVPVIATNVCSIPELVTDGKEGVLVQPNDADALVRAVKSITSDSESWRARVHAAKEKARAFSASSTAAAIDVVVRGSVRQP